MSIHIYVECKNANYVGLWCYCVYAKAFQNKLDEKKIILDEFMRMHVCVDQCVWVYVIGFSHSILCGWVIPLPTGNGDGHVITKFDIESLHEGQKYHFPVCKDK